MQRRVVVTGLGVLAPGGIGTEAFWHVISEGRSEVQTISRFDTSGFPCRIAGELRDFDPSLYIERKEGRRMDLYCQYAVYSAAMAAEDAGIYLDKDEADRTGVIYGSGIGGIQTLEDQHQMMITRGPRRINPFFVPMMIADMAAGLISIRLGAKGPNFATVSACASGAHAIGCAFKTIRQGEADVMICGGAEAPITPLAVGGFSSAKTLSTRNEEPERASRPFDAERDGFVIGEGAGTLILEELAHAQARDANIYAEVVGVGFTGDAYHITAPPPGHEGAARAMAIAIKDAGLEPTEVQYVNAHGTSTPHNDKNETKALKSVFGEHAYTLAISSTKSMIGHLLGASGAVELIATVLAIQRGLLPPTINYEHPDPECDLDYVPNVARPKTIDVALSSSFGFGGHNAVIAVRRFHPGRGVPGDG